LPNPTERRCSVAGAANQIPDRFGAVVNAAATAADKSLSRNLGWTEDARGETRTSRPQGIPACDFATIAIHKTSDVDFHRMTD